MGRENRKKRQSAGFTMLEMLMVLVIISTLGSVAIPTFSGWLPDRRLKAAARDLYSHIQGAKMEAVKQHTDINVTFQTGPDSYTVPGVLPGPVVLGDYKSGICYGAPGGFTNSYTTITYNQRGICTAGSDTYVYITNDRKSDYYRVGPNPAGIVHLEKWNGSAFE